MTAELRAVKAVSDKTMPWFFLMVLLG